MFSSEAVVRLYDTDAAGFLFFGAQFRLAHEALEMFLERLGMPIAQAVSSRNVLFPVVHAEADYRVPLRLGDRLTVRVAVHALGKRSFTMNYRLLAAGGQDVGSVTTVHAALSPVSGKSCPLPGAVRVAFAPYLEAAGQLAPVQPGRTGRTSATTGKRTVPAHRQRPGRT